jgi:hypothetical protein
MVQSSNWTFCLFSMELRGNIHGDTTLQERMTRGNDAMQHEPQYPTTSGLRNVLSFTFIYMYCLANPTTWQTFAKSVRTVDTWRLDRVGLY